ncbi:MAG: Trm112 family protein [Candidatus Delongbacteria bacterium]|nr:Trm112 family protein [Candidatus Delongbacteria bacterium]
MSISEELLQILACPQCHGSLRPEEEDLICDACRLAWPIVDGIPDFMPDSARKVPVGEQGGREETE